MAFRREKSEALGVKAPFPGFVAPALATAIERVPSGKRWIHEIKFDGYRVQVHLANEAIKVYTRRGHDWTRRFKNPINGVEPERSEDDIQREQLGPRGVPGKESPAKMTPQREKKTLKTAGRPRQGRPGPPRVLRFWQRCQGSLNPSSQH
ncbi:hypothetical protein [Bradyrhizobium sp. WSM3983]|uniref:ATP-dependent DNA ligase n=1 Tax=Bradyrhizobium sp. WSM3983 TaxID=1038867 RepID=UPI00042847C7|nr:hypothetical protein [Bradyrhizobium sp. WSM3983]